MSYNQKPPCGAGAGNSGSGGGLPPNNPQQVAKTLAGIQQQMQNLVHGQNALPQSTQADINALLQQQRMQNMFKTQQQLLQQHFQLQQHHQQQQQQQQHKDRSIIAAVTSTGEPLALTRPITGSTNAAATAAAAAAELLNKTYQQQQQQQQSQHSNGASGSGNVALNQLQQQIQAIPPNIMQQIQAIQYQMHQQQQQPPSQGQAPILPTHTTLTQQQHAQQQHHVQPQPAESVHHTSSSIQMHTLPNPQQPHRPIVPPVALSITPQQQQQKALTSAVQQLQQTLQQRYLSAAAAAVSASSHSVAEVATAVGTSSGSKLASGITPTSAAAIPSNANQTKLPTVNLSPSTNNKHISPVSNIAAANNNASIDNNKPTKTTFTSTSVVPISTTISTLKLPKQTSTITTASKHGISGMKMPTQISPTTNTIKPITSPIMTTATSINKDSIIKNQTNSLPLQVDKSTTVISLKPTIASATVESKKDASSPTNSKTAAVAGVSNNGKLKNYENEVSPVTPNSKMAKDNDTKIIEQSQQLENNFTNVTNVELKIKDNFTSVPKIDEKKNKCESDAECTVNELEQVKPNASKVSEKLENETGERIKITTGSGNKIIVDGNVRTKVERDKVSTEKIRFMDDKVSTEKIRFMDENVTENNKKCVHENLKDTGTKVAAVEMVTKVMEERQTIARSSARATKASTDNDTITTTAIIISPSKKSGRLSNKSTKQNVEEEKIKNIIATKTEASTSNILPIEKNNAAITKARLRRENKNKSEKNIKSSTSLANPTRCPTTSKAAVVSSSNKTKPLNDRKSQRHRLKTILYQSPLPELAYITKLSANEASNSPKPMVNEDKLIVFYKNEYMAVRNAEGTFYLCQTMQNVYRSSPRISIRWLSEDFKNSDVYKPDFYDHTDIECVLTTVELKRIDKGHLKLPVNEKSRIENILKKAIDVEKGIVPRPELTEENPDGLDLSLYKDESQIEKKSNSGSGRKSKRPNNFRKDTNSLSGEHDDNNDHANDNYNNDADDGDVSLNKRKRISKTGRNALFRKKTKRKLTAGKRSKAKGLDSADESIASDDGSGEEYKPKQKKNSTIAVSVSTKSSSISVVTLKSSPRAQRSLLAMARAASPLLSIPTTSRALNTSKNLTPKTPNNQTATSTSAISTFESRSERSTKRKAAVEQYSNAPGACMANNSKITPTKNRVKESHEVKESNTTTNSTSTTSTTTKSTNTSISNLETAVEAITSSTTSTTKTNSILSASILPSVVVGNKSAAATTTQLVSGTTSSGNNNRTTRSRK